MRIRYKWNHLRRVIEPSMLERYGEAFFEHELATWVRFVELCERDACFGDRR